MCNGHAAAGLRTGPQLQWHINCLELLPVWLALRFFKTLLHESHVLVQYGQHCSHYIHQPPRRSTLMSQLTRHLLLWSQMHLRSLRAVHIPGELSRRAVTSARPSGRMATPHRGSPADLETLPQPAVLLPVRGDPRHGRAGTQLALGPTQKYAFPPLSLLAQTLCKVRKDEEQVLLVAPYWPNRTWFPELMLLTTAPPWQRGGTLWHPRPDLWNLHVWSLDGTWRF